MSLHERLRECRVKKGVSVEEVAVKVGVAKRTYQGYERGERDISTVTLYKICQFLDVSADYLLGVEDEKSPPLTESEELREKIVSMTESFDVNQLKDIIKFVNYLIWLEEQS